MPGGTLKITAATYDATALVARRVVCWAGADATKLRTDSSGAITAVVIPEEIMAGKGALVLRRGGTDLVAGFVPGSQVTTNLTNATGAMSQPQNATTQVCTASTTQPTFSNVTMNVSGNPLQITLAYANVAAAGTVNITWGDGTSTNGAAESGTANHTYPKPGVYTITITDATVGTDTGSIVVSVPEGFRLF